MNCAVEFGGIRENSVLNTIKPCFRCKLLDFKASNVSVPAPHQDIWVKKAPAFISVKIDYPSFVPQE